MEQASQVAPWHLSPAQKMHEGSWKERAKSKICAISEAASVLGDRHLKEILFHGDTQLLQHDEIHILG